MAVKELSVDKHKAALADQIRRDGGVLRDAPSGPSMDYFHALELAFGIESEVNRMDDENASSVRKVVLTMDVDNAMRLAAYLRRAAMMGV